MEYHPGNGKEMSNDLGQKLNPCTTPHININSK